MNADMFSVDVVNIDMVNIVSWLHEALLIDLVLMLFYFRSAWKRLRMTGEKHRCQ